MRRHAKASSAGTTRHQATGLGRIFRGALATRDASLPSDGSGVPARWRSRAVLSVLVVAVAALVFAATASASKSILNYFGTNAGSGSLGGQFNTAMGIAVNASGTGPANPGDIYVVDELNNRVQRFAANGKFVSAWGANVTRRDEVQWFRVVASGGTYNLTFEGSTTGPINHNANAATVDNALDVLPSIGGDANVIVTGSFFEGYKVTFSGALMGTEVPELTANSEALTGNPRSLSIVTLEDGSGGAGTDYEVCAVASNCGAAFASAGNGTTAGNGAFNSPQFVAVDEDTGDVYVSDRNNYRVNVYDGAGVFLRSFGFDVDATEPSTGYEVCPETNVCKIGVEGAGVGQIGKVVGGLGSGSATNSLGIVVSQPDGNPSTGTVFLADTANRRVNTYDVDGTAPSSFGSASDFAINQPRKIAVDSRGIVYANDSSGNSSIQRYDYLDANGGGSVFLPRILAPVSEVQTIHFEGFEHTSPLQQYKLTCPNGELTDQTSYITTNVQGRFNVENVLNQKCGAGTVVNPAVGNPPNVTITYGGAYAGTNVPPVECFPVAPAAGTCSVTTVQEGFTGPLLPGFSESTAGLAVDPDSDGGGSDEDVLQVLRIGTGALVKAVQQFGPTNDPGLAAAPTAVDTDHVFDLTSSRQLGINPANGRLYVSSDFANTPGIGSGHRVYVFDEPSSVLSPGLTIDPVTIKGETSATFSGTVDPMGALVSCDFQYSTDQASWVDVESAGARSNGTLLDSTTVISIASGQFKVGQTVTAANGGIPPNTQISAVGNGQVTLSQAATKTGPTEIIAPGCSVLNTSGGPQAVSVTVTGLEPNTQYYVRLAGSRPLVPNSTTTTVNVQPFQTDAVPPAISKVGAVDIGDTSVRLIATIDPRNSETGYVFQYGTTPALGSSTAPLNVGGGTTPTIVSQVIGGLAPDTTYYFRVVATNLTGTTTGSSHTVQTRALPSVSPPGRGIEMVSPIDKNFADVNRAALFQQGVQASVTGNAVGYCTSAIFGEPAGTMEIRCANYFAKRTGDGPTGWESINPNPPHCHYTIDGSEGSVWSSPSEDFSRWIQLVSEGSGCPVPPLDPDAPISPPAQGAAANIYLQNWDTNPESYNLVNPKLGGFEPGGLFEQMPIAGSDDYSHVVFSSYNNQTDPPDSPAPGSFRKLYLWTIEGEGNCEQPGGCLTLLSKNSSNEPFTTSSNMPQIPGWFGFSAHSSVSSDGNRIYFQNPVENTFWNGTTCNNAGCDLQMRENAEVTHTVSTSECTLGAACGSPQTKPDVFLTATPSGDHAFFISCAKLTDASSPQGGCTGVAGTESWANGLKLYRWDRNGAPGHRLIDITADEEPNDGVQPDPRSLVGVSDDGNAAYFVASGQLVSGEPTTADAKMYRWQYNEGNPTIDYLGLVGPINKFGNNMQLKRGVVSANGDYVLIYTSRPIDEAADGDSDRDAYRWDEENGWICVSCQPPGVPSAGPVNTRIYEAENAPGSPLASSLNSAEEKHYIANNGDVFFGTPDALVPGDVNGEGGCPINPVFSSEFHGGSIYQCEDVYQYHDGKVYLLSSGTGSNGAVFISTTPSGDDAFFYTDQRLVGWDQDNNVDIYDSRVGGGFPEPLPQPPSCEGEACRGAGSVPLDVSGAGTKVFEGPGNQRKQLNAKRCRRGFVKRRGKCVSRKTLARKRAARRRAQRAANQTRRAYR